MGGCTADLRLAGQIELSVPDGGFERNDVRRLLLTFGRAKSMCPIPFAMLIKLEAAAESTSSESVEEPEGKRKAIDEALSGAGETASQRVREALLKVEHVALARRFREFVVAHTAPAYFREGLEHDDLRMGRSEMVGALSWPISHARNTCISSRNCRIL